MATFILICRDKPGALELRMATRDAHLAWVDGKIDMVIRAGPLLDEGGAMAGSLFTLEADSRADVEAFTAADPYSKAGLFESVEILKWRQTIGAP
jgi:uncharacterized protein YciI